MRTEGRTHLDVPTHQLKLGRSKSLNTPRTAASIVAMNVRPKRTHSLPNRERSSLPIVQINSSDNDRFEEDYYSDEKEGERTGYGTSTANYTSGGGDSMEPLFGVILSIIFLIWSWMLEAYNL